MFWYLGAFYFYFFASQTLNPDLVEYFSDVFFMWSTVNMKALHF